MKIWLAIQEEDCEAFNVLAKTKKELIEKIKINTFATFREAWHLEIDCSDSFELIRSITGESGGRNHLMGKPIAHYQIKPDFSFKKIKKNSYIDFFGEVKEFLSK